jgi:lipopolysaccharide biosynthesis glycosyltransferase
MSSSIPIVFSADNFFLPYTAVMIQSIMENANSERNYHVFILHKNIEERNTELLAQQCQQYPNFSLDFINVSSYIKEYSFWTANRETITVETYFRLLIPDLFPDYDKVIYLDGDMICCADVSALFDINIEDYHLASSRDIGNIGDYHNPKSKGRRIYNDTVLKLNCADNYFIAGMLILNIKAFKNNFTVKKLLDFAISREWRAHDQDILNVLCQDKTLLLPIEWDFTWDDEAAKYLPDFLKTEYDNTKNHPKIIHFPGERKPWLNAVNVPYFEYFWKYATRTPFIDVIMSRMQDQKLTGKTYKEHIEYDIQNRRKLGFRFIFQCFVSRFKKNLGINK